MNPLWILLLTFSFSLPTWARVRKVELAQDQIATVKTAIGIATIIQVPDRPNSIVVGDQSAFKVEYLDQAITIKPLRGGAKSNLYIYTDFRRFNVQLITGAEPNADYVVYLENEKPKSQPSTIHWTNMKRELVSDGLRLQLKRAARTRDGVVLFEFEFSSQTKVALKPDWIWLTQTGTTRPIQNLVLSNLNAGPSAPVIGTLQVLRSDIDDTQPLRFELRRKKTSSFSIPKVSSWK